MEIPQVIESLFKLGLGRHLVLHVQNTKVVLGQLVYEKNKLKLMDSGFLTETNPEIFRPCWEGGVLGAVCSSEDYEWNNLTFYGLDKCKIKVSLGSTRSGALMAVKNEYGDNLIEFTGSIYRGYQLMLQHHFLPVILLNKVETATGKTGLAVADLRVAPMPLNVIKTINNFVWEAIEDKLSLQVEDIGMDSAAFKKLFGGFVDE